MIQLLRDCAAALADTGVSQWLGLHGWAVPLLQTVHILAVGIVLAGVLLLDLRLAGLAGRNEPIRVMALRYYLWIRRGLAVLLATGLLQVLAEPARELLNRLFWTKLGLIVVAAAFTAAPRGLLADCRLVQLPPGARVVVRGCGMVSLVLWVLVVICGRLIAYAGDLTAGAGG